MGEGRTICVITGSRAEYGLLRPVMHAIQASTTLRLQVAVTGMHLSARFGDTWKQIEEDGFTIHARIDSLAEEDDSLGICRSVSSGVTATAEALERLAPDMVLVLGDRYEILAVVQASLFCRIPVAHLCGGDVTEGAYDDAIRHCITKMSHIHFPTHEAAARRIRQLGEAAQRIHTVGHTGLDTIRNLQASSRAQLSTSLGFQFRQRNLLITYHPETLDDVRPSVRFQELLTALETLDSDLGLLFTMPNADEGGQELFSMVQEYVDSREHAAAWVSLGQERYLSTMALCDAVVGNSSSGLYEAPSMNTPTVNIGGRQDGRPRASSVIDCTPQSEAIADAINVALSMDCSDTANPFGDGHAAARIVGVLESVADPASLLRKRFFDLESDS